MNDLEVRPPKDLFEYQYAVRDSDLPTSAKILALVIATYYNWTNRNDAWPTRATLAKGTGLGKSTVSKMLKVLQDRGYVVRSQRWDNSNLYEVTLPVSTGTEDKFDPRARRVPSVYESTKSGTQRTVSTPEPGAVQDVETNYEENYEVNSESNDELNTEARPASPPSRWLQAEAKDLQPSLEHMVDALEVPEHDLSGTEEAAGALDVSPPSKETLYWVMTKEEFLEGW